MAPPPGAMPLAQGAEPPKPWTMTLILCLVVGIFGGHRFYVGKTGSAVLMLVTLGGCGFWTLFDLYTIVTNKFTDKYGQLLIKT